MAFDLAVYLDERKACVDAALDRHLPPSEQEPRRLHEAMRHAVLSGGKRVRPILVLEVAALAGHPAEEVQKAACALEFVHSASLVLDDLPSMDNALTRRDRPCTHTVYGEATAILASLGLIGMAFELIAGNAEDLGRPATAAAAVHSLAEAIGPAGIIHGQHVDLGLVTEEVDIEALERIYGQKAGALFVAAVRVPACLLELDGAQRRALETYAGNVGLAFQIIDDLIDAHRKPEDRGKTTFATHLGAAGARDKADALLREAAEALAPFGDEAEALCQLAEYVRTRTA